jgi:MFS family permease
LFLVTDKAATRAAAAAGYAAFAAAMAVMRFVGDRLVAKTGRRRAVTLGGLTLAAGGSLALLAGDPLLSAAGFGLVGVGAANVVPVLLSTAARYPRGSGGVAAVSTIGYLGTLTWPPMIGGIAEAAGLPAALWLIAAAGIAIAVCAALVSKPWRIPQDGDGPSA